MEKRSHISKKFYFINNLDEKLLNLPADKKVINIIISKSGNTLETIANSNFLLKKNKKNIFITEFKKSYLNNLAKKKTIKLNQDAAQSYAITYHNKPFTPYANFTTPTFKAIKLIISAHAGLLSIKNKNLKQKA